jgi:hypothetical protein
MWRGGVSTVWNGPRGCGGARGGGGGGRCPNVEVQHLRKRRNPDVEERGALQWRGHPNMKRS